MSPWFRDSSAILWRRLVSAAGSASSTARPLCWASSAIPLTKTTTRRASTSPPPPSARPWTGDPRSPAGGRHGRVLLHTHHFHRPYVWGPIAGRLMAALPKMPPDDPDSWTTAVLCAATGTGACDHLDCQDGPSIVVHVGTDEVDPKGMFSYVFLSAR